MRWSGAAKRLIEVAREYLEKDHPGRIMIPLLYADMNDILTERRMNPDQIEIIKSLIVTYKIKFPEWV